jgi:hypothetical protein
MSPRRASPSGEAPSLIAEPMAASTSESTEFHFAIARLAHAEALASRLRREGFTVAIVSTAGRAGLLFSCERGEDGRPAFRGPSAVDRARVTSRSET